jgi:hypothetical protein
VSKPLFGICVNLAGLPPFHSLRAMGDAIPKSAMSPHD